MRANNFFIILILLLSEALTAQEIGFYSHIAPIIYTKCAPCHQPGKVGSMNLTTYEEVSAYGTMIKYVTGIRYMPPMKVVDSASPLHDDLSLSDQEIKLIQEWIDSGMPKGQGKDFIFKPDGQQSAMPDPDLVISMKEAFEQYGVYYDQYKVFVIPTGLEKDKRVKSIEFIPGNGDIVRSCFISVDTSSKSTPLDEWDPQYGYFSFGEIGFVPMESRWYNWQPNKKMTTYPDGYYKLLPKGAKLLLHIHYGPTGIPLQDSSVLKIRFAKSPTKRKIITAPIINPTNLTNKSFYIAANDSIRFHGKFILPFDIELSGVMPHSHFLGCRWEIFAVDPDRQTTLLLKIDDWDFHWKQMYHFKQSIQLKKGTVIHALSFYDNTINNPLNPSDPPKDVNWGKGMFEELFITYFEFVVLDSGSSYEVFTNFTNTTYEKNSFVLKLDKPGLFSARVKSFDGAIVIPLFEDRFLTTKNHTIEFDLKGLKHGNYFIEVENDSTFRCQPFLYLADKYFE